MVGGCKAIRFVVKQIPVQRDSNGYGFWVFLLIVHAGRSIRLDRELR